MAATSFRATATAENPLCARLQVKFSGRGAAAAGTRAAVNTTTRNIKNTAAAKTANPFEDTVEFVSAAPVKKAYNSASAYNAAALKRNTVVGSNAAAMGQTTTFDKGTFSAAYARAASIRAAAIQYNGTHAQAAQKAVTHAKPQPKSLIKAFVYGDAIEEKKIKSTPVSKGLVISAIVITLIVMLMLFSFAQINEFKNDISSLQDQKAELQTTIQDLNVSLDCKNDIRVIEETATKNIGMVKSNQVESKYVSVAGGERVEVIDNKSDTPSEEFGVFGTLLSAVGSNWNRLMEYIN